MGFRHRMGIFSRYALIVINTGIAILGLTIIALTLWIRLDANFEHVIRNNLLNVNENPPDLYQIKDEIRTAITVSFWVIIGFSIASLILSLIGIFAAISKNRKAHIFFIASFVILVLLEIGIGIFVIVYRSQIKMAIDTYTSLAFRYNTNDSVALIDRYECCGDGSNNLYNQRCLQPGTRLLRDCSTAVWDRLDQHLTITGLVMIGVILVKLLAILLSVNFFVN